MMDDDSMLTTIDNPWNPFTNFMEWYTWDHQAGYNTPSLLARIAKISDDLSDSDYNLAIGEAIDEIVKVNASGVHVKAFRPAA